LSCSGPVGAGDSVQDGGERSQQVGTAG